MERKQTRIVFGTILLVVAIWLVSPLFGSKQGPAGSADQFPLVFDAARSFATTRDLVTRFQRRVIGSIEARQSTGYLHNRFQSLGYKTSYSHFGVTIAGRKQVGRNIYAFKPGRMPEILALVAHYDTAGTTVQGAMDDASGIGVLLELARLFADRPTCRGLLFIASDGEEWGMLGVQDAVRNYPDRGLIVAALTLDYLAPGELSNFKLDTIGQTRGHTPPWLREIARAAAMAEQLPVSEPSGFQEHLERALLISWTDQGPFLNTGIPAINLGSESRDKAQELAVYHSPQDVIENLQAAGFEKYGRAAERIVRALDGLPSIPRESMASFRLVKNRYLSGIAVTFLQCLAFLPFALMCCFHLANHRQYLSLERIQREVHAFMGTFLPFLLFYPSILLLALLRQIPRYSFYPATPKDPILEHPMWGVLGGVLTFVLLAAVGCYFLVRFLNRKLARPDFYVAKSILLIAFLLVIALALLYNAYWAVSFLVLPAWLWGLVGAGKGAGGRAVNRILILAAGVLYYMLSCSYAVRLFLGWKLFWYETLALISGMFSWQGFVLASAVFALAIRFLSIQSYGSGD